MPTLDSNEELTFEQRKEIDRLSKLASTPSSNSNKCRFELYAYVGSIIEAAIREARLDEMNLLQNDAALYKTQYFEIMVVKYQEYIRNRIASLNQPTKEES